MTPYSLSLTHYPLLNHLSQFVTEARKKRFEEVLQNRTRYITVALEDIYQTHNSSAVLRSCDCFGIQDVHIIENKNKYSFNPDVSLGSEKWLTLHRYDKGNENNTLSCISNLKQAGYLIAVTSPHKESYSIKDIPLDKKLALFFGTEMQGISSELEKEADIFVKIPMLGFTESFNISVAAALCMNILSSAIRQKGILWQLNETEKEEVLLQWYRNTIPHCEMIEKEFCARK